MEKPARIIENEKIRNFNEKVRNGIEHALNFMMSGEQDANIQISFFEPFLMPIETYTAAYRKQSVLIKIHAENEFSGQIYWFFELKTAIVLSAMMRMVPVASLEEKLAKVDFDSTDQDAFGEAGNQLSGILDRAFRNLTKKNIHLRMDFKKVIYPSTATDLSTFENKEEYVVLLASITIPKYGSQKLTLLLPRSLYEVMLNLEISLEGITPRNVLMYSWNEGLAEKLRIGLNSRYTKIIPSPAPDEILTLVDTPNLAAVGIHLPKLTFPLQHLDTIFLKRLASNRTLMRLPYFLTWDKATQKEVDEVTKLGLAGATAESFADGFTNWAKAFTQKRP